VGPLQFPERHDEALPDRSTAGPEESPISEHLVRVDHIAVAVADLNVAIRWYSEVLGFKCIERRALDGRRSGMVSAVMQAGPIVFVLVQGTNPDSQVSRFIQHYGQGVQHVALQVNNIEGLVQRLDRRGMSFSTDIVKSPGLRQTFTKRSSQTGLMIELIERGEFSGFTDENVDSLFRQMEASDDF
jgi:methylmalonyl-CoA epimerase